MSSPMTRARRRRGRVFLVVAAFATLTLPALAAVPAATAAPPAGIAAPPTGPPVTDGPTAAALGAAHLGARLDAGIPLPGFGGPDWGLTLAAGLALAETGVRSDLLAPLWAAVVAERDTVVAPGGTDNPGRLGRAVLLAVLLGEDPRAVGADPGADLVGRIWATQRPGGPDAGLFGASDPTYDGALRQGLALAALSAAGATADPRTAAAAAWLESQQCPDGSWPGGRVPDPADPGAGCAFDPVLFSGADSNNTALALIGLAAAGADRAPGSAVARGVARLVASQEADGGWSYRPGDGTDPNSTALVRRALATLDAAGATGVADSLPALLSFQLGCDAPAADRGGFASPFSGGFADLLATVDAVPGAAGLPLPAPAAAPVAPTPELDCTPPTTLPPTTLPPTTLPPSTLPPSTLPPTTLPATTTPPTVAPTTVAPTTAVTTAPTPVAAVAGATAVRATGAAAGGSARLAVTGAGVLPLLAVGLGALVGGLALVRPRRRRPPG